MKTLFSFKSFFSYTIYAFILLPNLSLAQSKLNWVNQIGGEGNDYIEGFCVDSGDNVFIVGNFQDTVDFDPSPGIVNLTDEGVSGLFIAKYTENGDLLWAKSIVGSNLSSGASVYHIKY